MPDLIEQLKQLSEVMDRLHDILPKKILFGLLPKEIQRDGMNNDWTGELLWLANVPNKAISRIQALQAAAEYREVWTSGDRCCECSDVIEINEPFVIQDTGDSVGGPWCLQCAKKYGYPDHRCTVYLNNGEGRQNIDAAPKTR